MPDFDPNKPKTCIQYFDVNYLYWWAIFQALPTCGFEWIDPDTACQALQQPTDAEKGYILEVDIDYLQQLHNAHNAYLLVPERLKVDKAWMSDYQQGLQHKMYGRGVEKLVPNLRDKTNYVLHYQNLQLYLQLGMRLKKNHRALRFD